MYYLHCLCRPTVLRSAYHESHSDINTIVSEFGKICVISVNRLASTVYPDQSAP